jgi:hypothetical protein
MTPCRSPVALFIFRRPKETERVLAAVRVARPQRLLVVADGPRRDHPEDERRCVQTRRLFDDVGWPCEVQLEFADENLGCGRRMASGISWVFEQVEEAILLEDDCLAHPSFFQWCDEMLERYRTDTRVGHVAGTNFLGCFAPDDQSYFFSLRADVWGWASWRRAWRHYDFSASAWPEANRRGLIEKAAPGLGYARQLAPNLDAIRRGELDTWDYQWHLTMVLQRMLQVVPAQNLISNIGFSHEATHTRDVLSAGNNLPSGPLAFPLRHPSVMAPSLEYEHETMRQSELRILQVRDVLGRAASNGLLRAAERLR